MIQGQSAKASRAIPPVGCSSTLTESSAAASSEEVVEIRSHDSGHSGSENMPTDREGQMPSPANFDEYSANCQGNAVRILALI